MTTTKTTTTSDGYYHKLTIFPFAGYNVSKTFCQTHERADELMREDIARHDPFQRIA